MRRVESVGFDAFEWDEVKAHWNYKKHAIRFEDAAAALSFPHLEEPSDRNGEKRTLAICPVAARIVAVVYTLRDDKCRIISVRAARDYEQREYRLVYP